MLGNAGEARFIRDWYIHNLSDKNGDRWTYDGPHAPEGWEKLGSGCSRAAFLSPSGVVYKVQHNYDGYIGQSNSGEASTLRRYFLKKMPRGCRLPRYTYYDLDGRSVMAMERFSKLLSNYSRYGGDGERYWNALSRLQDAMLDLYDLHGANLAVDEENKLLVPIDLGG